LFLAILTSKFEGKGLTLVRRVFLIVLLAGFSWLLFILGRETGRVGGGGGPSQMQSDEDIGVENVSFSEWKGGELVWTLHARKMRYYHRENRVDFEEVDVSMPIQAGGSLQIEAKTICYDTETGNLTAEGDVKGKNDQGYEFLTHTLAYDAEKREVQTPDKVTLQKDRLTVEGVGMKGFLERHRIDLRSEVRAHLLPLGGA
jgi:LPS export ABC transporter protein LptC